MQFGQIVESDNLVDEGLADPWEWPPLEWGTDPALEKKLAAASHLLSSSFSWENRIQADAHILLTRRKWRDMSKA